MRSGRTATMRKKVPLSRVFLLADDNMINLSAPWTLHKRDTGYDNTL